MAVDRSMFTAAGASEDTRFDVFWDDLQDAINGLAALYVGKKSHGTAPADILNGLYFGDDTLTTEKNWRIYSDSSGNLNIERNTGSDSSPSWSSRLQIPTTGAFVTNAMVDTAAAITRSKLASGTSYRWVVNNSSGVMTDASAVTGGRVVVSDTNGQPAALPALAVDYVLVSGSGDGLPTVSTLTTAQAAILATGNWTAAQILRSQGNTKRVPFLFGGSVAAGIVWTNMPAALTLFNGNAGAIQKVDLTNFTQVRLMVNKLGVAGAAGAKIRLLYKTTYDQTVANHLTIGSSEVQCAVDTTNAYVDSGYINLVAGAKAEVFVSLAGITGDGAIDPVFGDIVAEFK